MALSRGARDLPVVGGARSGRGRRLLVLDKVGGTEDVLAALAGRGPDAPTPAVLARREVKAIFRAFIGEDHGLLTDLDYRPGDPRLGALKRGYREFLVPVVRILHDELELAGIISANVTYFAERELAGACEEVGLPFLVLHKESIRSPRQRQLFTLAYRERTGPFTGRSVAVYNRGERDSQVEGGVVVDAEVVGAPRIDVLHEHRRTAARTLDQDSPLVLFAIDPGAGTWTPFDGERETGAPRWDELARATEDAFLSAARAAPGRRFVIKAKVGHGGRLLDRLPSGIPGNVTVVTDGTATDLLLEAAAIVGFNTTVVAEGLATGVPVIVPAFAEAAAPGAEAWCYPVGDAARRVTDPADLATVVLDAARGASGTVRGRDLDASTAAVLDELVGNSDGRAADRTWAWLRRELELG